jgi:uncharacterized protein (TIGR02145 family)
MFRHFIFPLFFIAIIPQVYAQSTNDNGLSHILNNIYSIIYPSSAGDYVAVKVGKHWWAPVNLEVNTNREIDDETDSREKLFPRPEKVNPCPKGWQLPTLAHFKVLDSLARIGKSNFDYIQKALVFEADNDHGKLILPADGIMTANGIVRGKGLTGSYWAIMDNGTKNIDYAARLMFQGSLINIGHGNKRSKMSIRCVKQILSR